jgi:uncharacterized protein YjbJ (UPF0337 family)
MAETIRELAEQEPEELRQQIDDTRSSITEKLEALEGQVTGTVENVKETVEETIAQVKETVQETVSTVKDTVSDTVDTVKDTFNLSLQTRKHPWGMLGGALVTGFVSGALIGEARRRRGPMPVERLESHGEVPRATFREEVQETSAPAPKRPVFGRFQEEFDTLKGLALGYLFGAIRDVIQENAPQMAEQVGNVMDNITTKFGGKPMPGPVLQREPFPR